MTEGRVQIESRGRVTIATLTGELDISNVAEIGDEIFAAIGNDQFGLCIDLSETRYIDSAGVRMIFDLVARLETGRQGVAVVVPGDAPVRRLIEVTNLAGAVTVCAALDECVEYIEGAVEDLL